ncbi:3-hydroxyacyl-CoA dehydrogenase NAD-binding domain-containing protein [Streptomyces sp. NPDC058430]|uniref:3-hydroxyacyl-CoA dehydrogenase NAD-binding domain-containing protein n=1 Tax=Streptomyces sp. NPDC058430 TaxID=3346495 RepID=UPI00365C62B7
MPDARRHATNIGAPWLKVRGPNPRSTDLGLITTEAAHAVRESLSAAGSDITIGTNTSAILIDELVDTVSHPERLLGVHWMDSRACSSPCCAKPSESSMKASRSRTGPDRRDRPRLLHLAAAVLRAVRDRRLLGPRHRPERFGRERAAWWRATRSRCKRRQERPIARPAVRPANTFVTPE